jgi:Ca-activated chloride channel family protein
VAQAAGGFYVHLENGPRTMKQLFSDGLAKMQVADINARLSRRAIERYEWPLSAAILFFALALLINDRKGPRAARRRPELKRSIAAAAAVLFVAAGGWARAASPGLQLYEEQKFPEAYEHFQKTLQENPGARPTDRIQFDAGAAAYKMKDYNKALQSFSQALLSKDPHLQSESHYNLGNTLYERGEAEKSDAKKLSNWEGALPHYEETLKAEPQNKNAKDNYEFVKKKIEELKKKQEQKPSPTPSPSPSPSPQKDQKNDQKQDDKNQQQNKDQQQKDQQQKDQQQQSQNGQGSGEGQKSENNKQSPSPTPTPAGSPTPSAAPSASPSPTPGENGAGESPAPTPEPSPSEGEQQGASPTPSSEGSPSPTPGSSDQNGGENGEQPSPTPAGSPSKPLSGDVKGAGEEKPKGDQQAAPAEVEPEKEGEMSPKQAAALLQSMKDEEQKVQLDEHKSMRPVYKDW